jgi:hypothetical protein
MRRPGGWPGLFVLITTLIKIIHLTRVAEVEHDTSISTRRFVQ